MKAPWLKHALIGVTDQATLPLEGVVGDFIQQIVAQPIEPALAFSQAIGIWAACQQANINSLEINTDVLTELEVITPECTLEENHPSMNLLTSILSGSNFRLIYEALNRVNETEKRLPSHLLATALDVGKRNTEIRTTLLKAIGMKGQWLARLNPAWKYATSELAEEVEEHDERLWHEGNFTQRENFFKYCRAHTPDRARELLESELKALPAKERLVFVDLMENNISLADEAMLVLLLKDRSKDVKDKAADLLAHLPNTAYAQQMTAIIEEFIVYKKGLLGKVWTCAAPQAFKTEWTALGHVKELPGYYKGGGERAWWLMQLVSKTPLAWWSEHTGMSAHELLAWATKTDWSEPLIHGWLEGLTPNDVEWIKALLEKPQTSKQGYLSSNHKLARVFPLTSKETRLEIMQNLPKNVYEIHHIMSTLIDALTFDMHLPKEFSTRIIDVFNSDYKKAKTKEGYGKRHLYSSLVWAVNLDSLMQWALPKRREDESPSEEAWFSEMELNLATRKSLHQYFV